MSFVLSSEHQKWFKETHGIEIKDIPSNEKLAWTEKKNAFMKSTFGDEDDYILECITECITGGDKLSLIWDEYVHACSVATFTYPLRSTSKFAIGSQWILDNVKLSGDKQLVFDEQKEIYRELRSQPWRHRHDGRTVGQAVENEFIREYIGKKIVKLINAYISDWFKANPSPSNIRENIFSLMKAEERKYDEEEEESEEEEDSISENSESEEEEDEEEEVKVVKVVVEEELEIEVEVEEEEEEEDEEDEEDEEEEDEEDDEDDEE